MRVQSESRRSLSSFVSKVMKWACENESNHLKWLYKKLWKSLELILFFWSTFFIKPNYSISPFSHLYIARPISLDTIAYFKRLTPILFDDRYTFKPTEKRNFFFSSFYYYGPFSQPILCLRVERGRAKCNIMSLSYKHSSKLQCKVYTLVYI